MEILRAALRTSARCSLLAVLLLVQPAAGGDEPPRQIETGTADPCEVGRALSRMAPCLAGDEGCAAADLWARRFGPSRPAPAGRERPAAANSDGVGGSAGSVQLPKVPRTRIAGAIEEPRPGAPRGTVFYRPPVGLCPTAPATATVIASPPDR